jgi:Putative DNA-binding domain
MERSTIEGLITSYIEQDVDGQEVENPKLDFKTKWYDLQNSKDINEFLKDTSAIANTIGPDGFIIIGYNTKEKSFSQASFSNCNLKDTSHITDLINKKIDRLFNIAVYDLNIKNNKISVLHIPPSLDKPHVIRNYQTFDKNNNLVKEEQHRIFVRKNTSTYPASKYDIELMFYDRKNIIPDYKVLCSFHTDTLKISESGTQSYPDPKKITEVTAEMNLVFENLGKRPVAIIEIQISFTLNENPSSFDIMHFTTLNEYKRSEIIVQPNKIVGLTVKLKSDFYKSFGYEDTVKFVYELNKLKKLIRSKTLTLLLSTGEKLKCDLIKMTE